MNPVIFHIQSHWGLLCVVVIINHAFYAWLFTFNRFAISITNPPGWESQKGRTLKLHAAADDPEEAEASRGLKILFDTYKNLAKLNYEAESLSIAKLVSELKTEAYMIKIDNLHMNKYVTRLEETNNAFKTLFSGRMVTTAMSESYDMKAIRKELQETYTDFTAYVLAMAKATEGQLFVTALNLLNAARKYYSDQMLSNNTPKPETPVD